MRCCVSVSFFTRLPPYSLVKSRWLKPLSGYTLHPCEGYTPRNPYKNRVGAHGQSLNPCWAWAVVFWDSEDVLSRWSEEQEQYSSPTSSQRTTLMIYKSHDTRSLRVESVARSRRASRQAVDESWLWCTSITRSCWCFISIMCLKMFLHFYNDSGNVIRGFV